MNDPQSIRAAARGRHLGAEVLGVDLAQPLSDAAFERVLDHVHEHGVVFFRRQKLTPQQLVAFSKRFGELDVHHMSEHLYPDLPWLRVLSNEKRADGSTRGITRGGMHWHSDLSYKRVPAMVTLLYGIVCPPTGADTEFASMYLAYDELPAATRERLRGAIAVHDRNFRYAELYPNRKPLTADQIAKVPPVEHPVIRLHPATRKPCLFVSKDVTVRIVGWDHEESRALIDEIEARATRPEVIYAHQWQEGDVLIWDNRCTLHRATPYDFDRYTRTLYRTQVKGEAPVPA